MVVAISTRTPPMIHPHPGVQNHDGTHAREHVATDVACPQWGIEISRHLPAEGTRKWGSLTNGRPTQDPHQRAAPGPDPIGHWTFTPSDGRASLCRSGAALLGDPALHQHDTLADHPTWLTRVHAHDRAAVILELTRALGTCGESIGLHVACRLRLGDAEPSVDTAYGWFRIDADRSGADLCGTITRADADERALNLLAHRMHRLEIMLSTVSECFKIVDRDCTLLEMNSAGLDLVEADSMDQVRGASVLDLLCPEYHAAYTRGHEAAFRGERVTQRFEVQGLNGTRRWMEQVAVVLPSPSADDPPTEIGAFTRDITMPTKMIEELSEARLRAEQASRTKSAFLANMSHEIRTPLTAILGFAELLGPDGALADDEAETREAVRSVRSNAEHLLTIVNDVLDMSNIEAGRLAIEESVVDPSEVIGEVVSLLSPRAQAKGLSLETRVTGAGPGTVLTDPTRLRQVLLNLVGNAIKFTDRGGVVIDLHYHQEARKLEFRIEDTGIGMSPDELARVSRFEPFSQADTSMTRRFGGTGVGLRISHALCRMLGGDLRMVSSIGRGSVFTASIGAGTVPTTPSLAPDAEPAHAPDAMRDVRIDGLRVLLVEDGIDNQRLIAFHLRKAGAAVEIAPNGLIAAERMEQAPDAFDLVLMDMQMPELDGYDATRRIRGAGVDLPIVALTAHAMTGDREKCLEAGCTDFLTKPIDWLLLVDTCRSWGRSQGAQPNDGDARRAA